MAAGRPSKFPKLPAVIHPVARGLLFKRVLRKAAFPKAKTSKRSRHPGRWRSISLGTLAERLSLASAVQTEGCCGTRRASAPATHEVGDGNPIGRRVLIHGLA
jgi:hypothetical protein